MIYDKNAKDYRMHGLACITLSSSKSLFREKSGKHLLCIPTEKYTLVYTILRVDIILVLPTIAHQSSPSTLL